MNDQLWSAVEELISEIMRRILREEDQRNPSVSQIGRPVWMTEAQLAGHWQMITPDGKAKVHAIRTDGAPSRSASVAVRLHGRFPSLPPERG